MNNGAGEEQDAGGNGQGEEVIVPNPNVDPNDDANQYNDGQGNRGQ